VFVGSAHAQLAQQAIPMAAQIIEGALHLCGFSQRAMSGETVHLLRVCESGGPNLASGGFS
jgi:hypothetical protein